MTFYTSTIFREAQQADAGGLLSPNDCSVVIGMTYLASSVVALILKKHIGRRVLLLASELLMGAAQAGHTHLCFSAHDSKFHSA